MECVKCGKKTDNAQVFCTHCLEVMEAYPVKPDARIQLPTRPAEQPQKKQSKKRRPLNTDELVIAQRKKIHQQRVFLILLAVLQLLTLGALFFAVTRAVDLEIGKNYTYIKPAG